MWTAEFNNSMSLSNTEYLSTPVNCNARGYFHFVAHNRHNYRSVVTHSIPVHRHSVISLCGLVLSLSGSSEPLSETAVTHRPQGVIIVSIYMSSNIYYYYLLLLLYLSRKVLCRRIGLQRLSATFSGNFRG